MREWKPGDVAKSEHAGISVVSPRCDKHFAQGPHWHHMSGGWDRLDDSLSRGKFRPVVLFDPEDEDAAERLCELFVQSGVWRVIPADIDDTRAYRREQVQAALRELADPKPPKPEEPQDVGALVTASFEGGDGKGFGPALWAHCGDGSWVCLTDGYARLSTSWAFLTVTP